MPKALLIIAQSGYQDQELAGTRTGLVDAGFEVELASREAGTCTGKFGGRETVRMGLRSVRVEDFDRIAFIGGPGAEAFIDDEDAHRIARETLIAGKPLGAICIAPMILAAAGVLKAKRATVWDDPSARSPSTGSPLRQGYAGQAGRAGQARQGPQADFLEQHGAILADEPVVEDGLIVTANGPEAAEEFGRAFASCPAQR